VGEGARGGGIRHRTQPGMRYNKQQKTRVIREQF
jgi:hypothetical protein